MGLLSKILPALEIAGGVALLATGAGALAGGLLITQGIASSGLIGGSIGKFLKSDLGQGLMTAASLGATAYAMFGTDALTTAATAENAGVADAAGQASSAAAVDQGVQASAAATTGDLAKTGVSFSNSIGVNTAAFPDAATATYNGAPLTEMTGSTAVADNISPTSNLSMTQSLGADQNAVAQASGQSMPGMSGETGGINSGSPPAAAAAPSSQPPDMLAAPTGPNVAPTPSGDFTPSPDLAGAQYAQKYGLPLSEGPVTDTAPKGFFDKLASNPFLNSKFGSAAIQGAGSAIGGIGQGIMQQAAMDKQIAALQEPNRSFGSSAGQGVIAASQAPITVPNGYLQRAAALKSMLSSNGAGAVPNASSPVPVWQMQSTPRGGVPGG